MAYKYTGDSIINASLTVQTPKPLDSRTVVNNIRELYSIPAQYAYVGMTVANVDNGNTYMLIDKSKITEKAGWKASYESIQIITCTEAEYKTWKENTDEFFQPINDQIDYIHQDTYYYIYEDSLTAESELQEYVRRSDWVEVLNTLSGKASNDALVNTNNEIAQMKIDYATIAYVQGNYVPKTDIDLTNPNSFLSTTLDRYYTKEQTDDIFVTKASLNGGGLDGDNFVFVTAARYEEDQTALATYKQSIAAELAQTLKVGANGQLDTLIISHIKSPEVSGQQLTVDITPQGLSIGGDPLAKISEVPKIINITSAAYQVLVENEQIVPDAYYFITDDTASYVLLGYLEANYHTITQYQSYITGRYYNKTEIDNIVATLQQSGSYVTTEQITNYYTKSETDSLFETKTDLATTLQDYVTLAMLGGEEGAEGDFIFAKQADFTAFQTSVNTALAQCLKTNQSGTLSELVVESIKSPEVNGNQTVINVTPTSVTINNDQVATISNIPKLVTLTQAQYNTLVENDEVDVDTYYYITDDANSYVTIAQLLESYHTIAQYQSWTTGQLDSYYTKTQIDTIVSGLQTSGNYVEVLTLNNYYTKNDSDTKYATKAQLNDYVTIAMLGGEGAEGDYIFVKNADYSAQRTQDLATIANTYVEKNSDATLNSLETSTVKNGNNIVTINSQLLFNNKPVAFSEDVPVIQTISKTAYDELVEKNPDVYYFVYNVDPELAFVTASELSNYYTKPQVDSKITETKEWVNQQNFLTQHQSLADYALKTQLFSGDYDDLDNKPNVITSSQSGLRIEIVQSLPENPDSNTIYIIQ